MVFNVLFVINILFAIIIIFFEHKNPTITWAWLMVCILLPYFGFIIYLVLGQDGKSNTKFYNKALKDNNIFKQFQKFENIEKINNKMYDEIINLNNNLCNNKVTLNNNIKLYFCGENKFKDLMEDIKLAKSYIHLQYFIIRNDKISNELITLLINKVKEGLEVKILLDAVGCLKVSKKIFNNFIEVGGEVQYFNKTFNSINANFRNHRKIVIIDGYKGYVGGFNIGDEYLGQNKKIGQWRDSHIKIEGDSVKYLQLRFIQDWNFCSEIPILKKYFPKTNIKNNNLVQIVSSGADTKYNNILLGYLKLINMAKKTIYIVTPYFIPDDSIMASLKVAILNGVDVKIVFPKNPDHHFVYGASLSHTIELTKIGACCYQYNKGFIHSKIIVVDNKIVSIGSANFDIRSFNRNFETNAYIYNSNIAKQVINEIKDNITNADIITIDWYNNRKVFYKIKESISRLLTPLL